MIVQFFANLVAKRKGHQRPLSGHLPHYLRRAGSEHPGDYPRTDCGGLVRHQTLPGVRRLLADLAQVFPQLAIYADLKAIRFCRPVLSRLAGFHGDVGVAGDRVLDWHGRHPQVHRLGRAGGVRGDVPAGRLADQQGRLEQYRPEPGRHQNAVARRRFRS